MGLFDITPAALRTAEQASSYHLTVPEGATRPRGSSDVREGTWSEIVEITAAEYESQPNGDIAVELACVISYESPNDVNHNRPFRARYGLFPQALRTGNKDDWQYKVTNMNIPRLRSLFLAAGVEGDLESDNGDAPGYSSDLQETFFGPESRLVNGKYWAKIRQSVRKDKDGNERVNTDVTHWTSVD